MAAATTLGLKIQLPKFEGPLSLLLYLIKKEEMDIFDIEIHRITNQYFEFIRQMRELDLEVAGEFVAMAATLIQIKSQLLLPQYNEAGEAIEVEDPRKELVQRLLEYQKYQEAARGLAGRPWLGRDVWTRGLKEKWEEMTEEIELEDNALFSLIASYRKAVRSLHRRVHRVTAKAQSVASRIMEIKDRLFIGKKVGLSELITAVDDRRRQVLMTFLSALELAKMGFIKLFQVEYQGELYIEAVKEIDANGISRVEEYEKVQSPEDLETPLTENLVKNLAEAPVPQSLPQNLEFKLEEDFELKTESLEASTSDLSAEDEVIDPAQMASDEEIELAYQELTSDGDQETSSEELILNPIQPKNQGEIDGSV